MSRPGKVYVVCAMDTEGPIKDPRKPEILDSWERVDVLVDELTSSTYRNRFPDSMGNGLVFSWFILTLTGFKTNPFGRPMDYNVVFDHYVNKYGNNFQNNRDGIYWHYHQPAPSGIGNEWCRDWTHTTEYFNILSHLVLDRQFFPTCYRAGGRIEDNDLSNWLEQWIPFDYSNASGNVDWERRESDGKMLKEICDWTRATKEWIPYHPSSSDYQSPGNQKRWIFRCPDLASPVHTLSEQDIEQAFRSAANGKDNVLSFFEHDRRNDVKDKIIKYACEPISRAAKRYPAVDWQYLNAEDAAHAVLNILQTKTLEFNAEVFDSNRLLIGSAGELFGPTPFVCVITDNQYQVVPVTQLGVNKWITGSLPIEKISKLGIAANNPSGQSGVSIFEFVEGQPKLKKNEGVLSR